jgi:NAD(P)-dependent dehydrogenase (short-subunit alcohol dehydrogenase family)
MSALVDTATQTRSLRDAVVVVTGGGGGLGAAIGRELTGAGAAVVVADVAEDRARELADELGPRASALALDVADPSSITDGVAAIADAHGRIDVLVNNAGVDRTDPLEEIPAEMWSRILDVNLLGPALLTQAAWPMLRSARGDVVNVVSTAAKRAWANASAYHASKWGLLGLSHALHVEGRACGIRVSAIVAGGMRTPFLLDRFPDIDLETLQEPAAVARVIRFVLELPAGTVMPETLVLPEQESSWP